MKCVWWQKSARYAGDQILIDTIHLYSIFLSRTSQIIIKRKLVERILFTCTNLTNGIQ